jgi:dienelactone hydrolase
VSDIVLYHHAQGLTDGVVAFADQLRAAGHQVRLPDLFEGATFGTLDEGVAAVEAMGFEAILDAGVSMGSDGPSEVVYAGFSLGALIAHKLAQTRPGAHGALFYHYGDVPVEMFGDTWPDGVSVQFHITKQDEWRENGVIEEFVRRVGEVASADLFEYPGSAHLFTDSSLAEYDAESARLLASRTLAFLDTH